jgi:hypothetical protein
LSADSFLWPFASSKPRGGGVRLKNSTGISTAYGLTGTQYNADAEGIFIVTAADVRPLLAADWVEVRAEVMDG